MEVIDFTEKDHQVILLSVYFQNSCFSVFYAHNTSHNKGSWEDKGRILRTYSIHSVPVAQVHSNIKKYLQDWDKNINFMECKARKNIRRNYSQVFS